MKNRLLCTALVLCLLLAGCGGQSGSQGGAAGSGDSPASGILALEQEGGAWEDSGGGAPVEDKSPTQEQADGGASASGKEPERTAASSAVAESPAAGSSPEKPAGSPAQASSSAPAASPSQAAASYPEGVSSSAPQASGAGGGPAAGVVASDYSAYLAQVEQEVVALINAERTSLGLNALAYNDSLVTAARIRSKEMYDYGYFAHARPDGRSWNTVLTVDVPVAYTGAGENIASTEHNYTDRDPAQDAAHWYALWYNSPSHYENIVHPLFTDVGVGIFYIQTGGMTYAYATTLFCVY